MTDTVPKPEDLQPAEKAILGALGADGVSRAIALGDWNAIRAAKGIGPKTGQRIVNELKDKAPAVMAMAGAAAHQSMITPNCQRITNQPL